ncbi:MAG: hypothetical protein WEB06_07525 [Actinomycetota bacterium]
MRKATITILALGLLLSFAGFGAAGAVAETVVTADMAVDRELVSARTNADGAITRVDLVDALSVYGDGRIRIVDRNASAGLRNLIGFEGPASASGSNVTWDVDVKGSKEMLTVAQHIKPKLPVSVTPTYFIGNRAVKAADVRGYSGEIAIEYRLANTTRKTENLEVTNAAGETVTAPIDTYVPFVGQASFELTPDVWERIDAPGASVVTDDQQIRHVTYTAILAPIVGTSTQTIRLAGRVKDFEMGEVRIVFQPLLPGGADTLAAKTIEGGTVLFQGVGAVDENLGKLEQGTLQLVDGLSQLYAGIVEARTGLGDVGTTDTIVDGLSQVLGGLEDLGDSQAGVPAIKAGVEELAAGIEEMLVGLGSAGTAGTILNGLAQVSGGLGQLGAPTGLAAAKGGVDQVNAGLTQAKTALVGLQAALGGSIAEIQGASATLGCPGSLNPACPLLDSALNSSHGLSTVTLPGLASLEAGTDAAKAGLDQVSGGLSAAIGAVGQLSAGVTAVTAGVQQVKAGLKSGDPNSPGVIEGLDAVAGGLAQVISGIGSVGTEDTLTDGASQLLSGSQNLADGVDQIAGGTSDAQAAASKIGDGQGQLSENGTKVIQAGIGGSLQEASAALASLNAMKRRAAEESFVFGPPEGADGSASYVFRIGEITKRNLETMIKLGIGAVMLMLLMTAGVPAMRRPA